MTFEPDDPLTPPPQTPVDGEKRFTMAEGDSELDTVLVEDGVEDGVEGGSTLPPRPLLPPLPSSDSRERSEEGEGSGETVQPEAGKAGDNRTIWWILGASIGLNLIASFTGISHYTLLVEIGVPICILVLLARPTVRWLAQGQRSSRAISFWLEKVDDRGGGFYGIMGVLTFLFLEAGDLRSLWNEHAGLLGLFRSMGWETVFGFSVRSFTNGVSASIWPWYWFNHLDVRAVWLAASAFVVFKAVGLAVRRWAPALLPENSDPDPKPHGPPTFGSDLSERLTADLSSGLKEDSDPPED